MLVAEEFCELGVCADSAERRPMYVPHLCNYGKAHDRPKAEVIPSYRCIQYATTGKTSEGGGGR